MSVSIPRLAPMALVALLLVATPAQAWVELHVLTYEARVELDRQGHARVEHVARLRVGGGPLRTLDVKIADRNVTLGEAATLEGVREGPAARISIPVTLEQRPDGDLRIDIDGKRGVGRGAYELRFAYAVDLLHQNAITLNGSMLRVVWTGPRLDDGVDNMKCTIVVPTSPTEPRVADEGDTTGFVDVAPSGGGGTLLPTLVRFADRDEIALVRPHVAKGEAVPWAVRIDPKALGELTDARLRAAPPPEPAVPVRPERRATYAGMGVLIALLYSIVVVLKHRQVSALARRRGSEARALVPLGLVARAALAGPLLAGGLALQAYDDDPVPGTVLVLAAVLLSVQVPPHARPRVRGPGRWLPLSEHDAFGPVLESGAGWLDGSTLSGRVCFMLACGGFGALVVALWRVSPYHAYLAALDVVVPVALFGTGLRRWLPPDPVHSSCAMLRNIVESLRRSGKSSGTRATVIGRVPLGATEADEIRVLVRSNRTPRGFVAIEIGLDWWQGSGGPVALPQILLRAVEGSECHEWLTRCVRRPRWLRGRDPHERVLVLSPPLPTVSTTVSITEELVRVLGSSPEASPARDRGAGETLGADRRHHRVVAGRGQPSCDGRGNRPASAVFVDG